MILIACSQCIKQITNLVLLRASAGHVQVSQIHDKFINSRTKNPRRKLTCKPLDNIVYRGDQAGKNNDNN